MEHVRKVIKAQLPNGHPRFYEFLLEAMELHNRKNDGYAGGGHPLGNFYRVANIMANYPDIPQGDPSAALIGMVIKQFDHILWSLNTQRFYTNSSVDEHLADIAVYMTILRCIRKERGIGDD